MDARRILVQFGALLPVLLPLLAAELQNAPSFMRALLWPASASVALTAFLCLWIGLETD
ncbi:MAG TPA: hypothetical protein VJW93_02565 [Candidatus Acidoferrales bacterium]|nr:hypothetical protein [Candidatus Acidoferrales bacterium]